MLQTASGTDGSRAQETRSGGQPFQDAVVATTAALPWMTGPAFISLWQACGLASLGYRVTYLLPWLAEKSQKRLWGNLRFKDFEAQVEWLTQEARDLTGLKLPDCQPYRAVYSRGMGSIVPLEDVFRAAPPTRCLVANEPEHLSWYPLSGGRSAARAERTIGLSMTDYDTYIRMLGVPMGSALAALVSRLHGDAIRRRIDLPLSLSPALTLPGVTMAVERVTGVMPAYARAPAVKEADQGIYFLGALIWEKGLADLVKIARMAGLAMDVIGSGPAEEGVKELARDQGADLRFKGASRRFWTDIPPYRVMVNPSRSEVLCTATADALVAGRHVVLPNCTGNMPFKAYPNVHFYEDLDGAVTAVQKALVVLPEAPEAVRKDFDWMSACRRLAELGGLA
jgi:digalactosyldiacylglycerol synthase